MLTLFTLMAGVILTQYTDSGLRGHLDIGGHHILDGKAPAFLLTWNDTCKYSTQHSKSKASLHFVPTVKL